MFSFFDENGNKYGIEESYYKGSLDNTYDFLWEWKDDSHSVLILNYGGKWAEDKCYVEILEFNEDHIYGYYYKTPADYMTSRVKVELKQHIATNVDISSLTTIAQPDGTIIIEGNVTANGKIKKFELQDLEGKTIVDLTTKNEKTAIKEENGKKVNVFTMDIASVAIPIQKMQLVFKVKDGDTSKGFAAIGYEYQFDAGTGDSNMGAYMSFFKNRSYTFAEVKNPTSGEATDNAQYVETILKDVDGVPMLVSAKEVKSAVLAAAAADAKIFPTSIITSTGCIATYKLEYGGDGCTAKVSGVIIKNGDGGFITIDNSAVFE